MILALMVFSVGPGAVADSHKAGTIQTVAGSGEHPGFEGDDGPAGEALLWYPWDVAPLPDGSFYVSDTYNHRIRFVDAGGTITTIAGTGQVGRLGDGGPAVEAQLNFPRGLSLDGAGSLLVADAGNNLVRRIDTKSGTITTVAGSGARGLDPNGDGGPATNASFYAPFDVVVANDGALVIADTYRHRIRRVDPLTGIITTIAGTGAAGFSGDEEPATAAQLLEPRGLASAVDGSLFVADTGNNRIRRIRPDGIITTVAGTGFPASPAPLLAFIPGGSPHIVVGDGGPATGAILSAPSAVVVDPHGRLLIADAGNYRIRRVEEDGTIRTIVGSGERLFCGDGGPATTACIHQPFGVEFDPTGNLYFAQTGSHRIRRVAPPFEPAPLL